MKVFLERLKQLRLEKGLTQIELGKKLGIKRNTYSDWENGKTEPRFDNLVKLADFFNVSLDWLFGRE